MEKQNKQPSVNGLCAKHPEKPITFYCEYCDEFLCLKCLVEHGTSFPTHDPQKIKHIARKYYDFVTKNEEKKANSVVSNVNIIEIMQTLRKTLKSIEKHLMGLAKEFNKNFRSDRKSETNKKINELMENKEYASLVKYGKSYKKRIVEEEKIIKGKEKELKKKVKFTQKLYENLIKEGNSSFEDEKVENIEDKKEEKYEKKSEIDDKISLKKENNIGKEETKEKGKKIEIKMFENVLCHLQRGKLYLYDIFTQQARIHELGIYENAEYIGSCKFDDKIYFAGGRIDSFDSDCVRRITIKSDLSISIKELEPMLYSKSCEALVMINPDILYSIGGLKENSAISTCEKLDIKNNKWIKIKPLHEKKYKCSAIIQSNKYIYCIGGKHASRENCFERYDTSNINNDWETIKFEIDCFKFITDNECRSICKINDNEFIIFSYYAIFSVDIAKKDCRKKVSLNCCLKYPTSTFYDEKAYAMLLNTEVLVFDIKTLRLTRLYFGKYLIDLKETNE